MLRRGMMARMTERFDSDGVWAGRPVWIILALMTLVGAALRFYALGQRDFWYDEGCSVIYVRDMLNWPGGFERLMTANTKFCQKMGRVCSIARKPIWAGLARKNRK